MGTTSRYAAPLNFPQLLFEIELSLQSLSHSTDLIFQKCPEALNVFVNILKYKSSSLSVHFCTTTGLATAQTERP